METGLRRRNRRTCLPSSCMAIGAGGLGVDPSSLVLAVAMATTCPLSLPEPRETPACDPPGFFSSLLDTLIGAIHESQD